MIDINTIVYGDTVNVSLIPTSTYGVISFGGTLLLLSYLSIAIVHFSDNCNM